MTNLRGEPIKDSVGALPTHILAPAVTRFLPDIQANSFGATLRPRRRCGTSGTGDALTSQLWKTPLGQWMNSG